MNIELDDKKVEFLEYFGEYHRNVVQLLQNTRLTKEQLDSTKSCTIDSMRVPLDRVCDVARKSGYERGLENGRRERVEAYEIASKDAERRGFESGKEWGITEGRHDGFSDGYNQRVEDGKRSVYDYREAFSKGYEAGKKSAQRDGKCMKSAVETGNELDAEAKVRILDDIGKVVTMQSGSSYDVDSFIRQCGHEVQLLGRTKWNAWPLMLRHDYVQARIDVGIPTVGIVVNGEHKGVVFPDGRFVAPLLSDWERFKDLASRVAKCDAARDHVMNVRVPDGKVGLFLFVDYRGNEFVLKNTEYGTVIVKGDLVLGVVSSKTAIEHTHGALQQCEEYGKLTRAVFAFVKWACGIDHRALPKFASDECDFSIWGIVATVRKESERFVVRHSDSQKEIGFFTVGKSQDVRRRDPVQWVAWKVVRSKFYGNMVL